MIVGGYDGSGTRGVVTLLQDLDVNMIVEDKGTNDIHAFQIYRGEGWPGLVKRVFNVTHSLNYKINDLPLELQAQSYADLSSMLSNLEVASDVLRKMKEKSNNNKKDKDSTKSTTSISYGFKAPATMLLLPFFQKHLPRGFKYLHIVRDGRDVAFSDNHSPVDKFYNVYMGEKKAQQIESSLEEQDFGYFTRIQIKSIQLWNEWNTQLYEYLLKQMEGNSQTSFDYLILRSEDILNNKYDALLKLANFVGSTKTQHDICCLSKQNVKDIGGVDEGDTGNNNNNPAVEDGDNGRHIFGAADFEEIRGRFHDFAGSNNAGNDRQPPKVWSDIGNWEDIRQKMVQQEQNKNDNQNIIEQPQTRRRLLEEQQHQQQHVVVDSKVRPGSNLHNAEKMGFDQMSRFYNSRHKITEDFHEKPKNVKDRYGKWKHRLEDNTELSVKLHEEGKEALAIFGYEPVKPFMDVQLDAQPCDETVICVDT